MRAAIEAFLGYLVGQKEASPHTIAAYRNDLGQFLDYLAAQDVRAWGQVTPAHVAAFLSWLQDRYAVSTVARKIAAVRSCLHFLVGQNVLRDDPSTAVPPPPVPRRQPRYLTVEEVSRFLDCPVGDDGKSLRDAALLELMVATGMRVSEVVRLTLHDLDLERGEIVCGGRQRRRLPLSPRAVEALRRYLEEGRPRLLQDEKEDVLFVNHRGLPLTRQGLWLIIKGRAEAAGLGQGVTPHVLRHSFAAHMLAQGESLEAVQECLGHANLATTQTYLELAHADYQANLES